MSSTVTVVDYGIGNIFSVRRALEVSGIASVILTAEPEEIRRANRIVLPGVGSFQDGMRGLSDRGLIAPLKEFAKSGNPLLGICLGMQLLATVGEEFGVSEGLDLIPGRVIRIPETDLSGNTLKAPFVGWRSLIKTDTSSWENSVLSNLSEDDSVYLVHSYYFCAENLRDVTAMYEYGSRRITAAVLRDNISGLQFHPEKSGAVGLSIMRRFLEI